DGRSRGRRASGRENRKTGVRTESRTPGSDGRLERPGSRSLRGRAGARLHVPPNAVASLPRGGREVSLSAGSRLGPYEIVSPLGARGMGEVYRAKDPRLGREVAVKVLPASFSKDADRLRRFEHEARAAGVLNHPNIPAVYDIGSGGGSPYVVTELLEGETLRTRLATGALSTRKALDYATQIARGLAAAHEKGIVHRDLKPENLFATKDGRGKILSRKR